MSDESTVLSVFSDHELAVLTAVCDTLAPSLTVTPDPGGFYARKASDLHIPTVLSHMLPRISNPTQLAGLKLALNLIDQAWFNGLVDRNPRPFLLMSPDERTALLQDWSGSGIGIRRQIFQALKRLTLFLFYTLLDETNCNPNWPAIDYSGPPPTPAPTERSIKPLTLTEDTTLDADVVIVGSGAGGGVMAGELTAAGLDVIVLEKGGYYVESDFDGRELPSAERLFEKQGFLTTEDLSVILLAGSTLGGGTTINWSASLRTPDHALHEWESVYGVTGFTGPEYQQALDAVSARINVNQEECALNEQNAVLERGSIALGYSYKTIPRNVKGCENCGFCNFGCRVGSKQGTMRTYLQDAHNRGARIAVNTHVDRVLIENGAAVGVIGTTRTSDGLPVRLTVRARAVVIAAGSIHTPAVLMRSGLTNEHIGRNLHLHPTSISYGIYEKPIHGWSGVIMSRYVSQFNNLDNGYGVVIETAPTHPGIAALVLAWSDGMQHKGVMGRIAHLSNMIIIARDRDGGRIALDKDGNPQIHYSLSTRDGAHLMRGILESMRIHRAAGALEIGGPHTTPHVYRANGKTDFEAYLRSIEAAGLQKNRFALTSAHQMSSARMGGNPAQGAIDPSGETFEVRNLYVADGSALPTASGVNPMLTIMSVAYIVAQHLKTRLTH